MNLKTKELLEACNYPTDGTCDLSREEKLVALVVEDCLAFVNLYGSRPWRDDVLKGLQERYGAK